MSEKNKEIKNAKVLKLDAEGHRIVHEKLAEIAQRFGQKVPEVAYAVVLETPPLTRTPGWADQNAIVLTDVETKSPEQVQAEFDAQKESAVEKARSQTVNEGWDAFSRIYPSPERTVESPIKTLKQERSWVEKKSAEQLKGIILSLEQKIAACQAAPEAALKETLSFTRSQYDFPDNPTQTQEIAKIMQLKMAAYAEIFAKIDKAVPYLEETKALYEQVLQEKQKAEAAQQAKTPETLSEMEKLSKSAEKLLPKIVKLASEYQEVQAENSLERLAVIVEEYIAVQSQWASCKRELYGLETQPQFPAMPDLPVLPRKLWKKIQQQS
jgi:hypothetical protein